MMAIEQALAYWVEKKKLTPKKALELVDALPPKLRHQDRAEDLLHRTIGIFSTIGAILLGLGVILFVGSNWEYMSSTAKVLILLVGMLATGSIGYYLAYERGTYERTGFGLLLVHTLVYGASIFLIAQIYHLPLTFWWGALLWFGGTAIMAYVLQSRLHVWLSVPLLLLFLGWLRASIAGGGSEADLFEDPTHSVFTLLPAISLGLIALSVLQNKYEFFAFGRKTLFNWGIFLMVFLLVLTTVDRTVFFNFLQFRADPLTVIVAVVSLVLVAAALWFAAFETPQGRWGIVALALYAAFLFIIATLPTWMGFPMSQFDGYYYEAAMNGMIFTGLFTLHTVLVFIFLLVIIWEGTQLRVPAVINIGMLGMAAAIIIQYFSWASKMLDRSMAFIVGGVVILALSAVLEKQRRKLLTSIQA